MGSEILPWSIVDLLVTEGMLTALQTMCTRVQLDTSVSVTQFASLSAVDTYARVQPVLPAVLVSVEGSIDIEPLIHIPQDHFIPLLLETHYEAQSWEDAIKAGHLYNLAITRHLEYQERIGSFSAAGVYRIDVSDTTVVETAVPMTYVAQVRAEAVARTYRRISGVIL